ncbi:hypothetical protein K466DRAFT_668522 [Polyporus arcularius HHB13444]|uniref:Uncharacterized protein n=1 Tax=Polyporus arcularius HHB13444 TaxID=1314778 RepID=A0A5C3NLN2_9APHY|nr:hypothetical protein K466DRAFT_668522 [Polyporus arcularius HHB13444]
MDKHGEQAASGRRLLDWHAPPLGSPTAARSSLEDGSLAASQRVSRSPFAVTGSVLTFVLLADVLGVSDPQRLAARCLGSRPRPCSALKSAQRLVLHCTSTKRADRLIWETERRGRVLAIAGEIRHSPRSRDVDWRFQRESKSLEDGGRPVMSARICA